MGIQNNWLISQHISRRLSSGDLVNHVTVNFDIELNNCNAIQLCRQSVQLNKWETSIADSTLARNFTNYANISEISLYSAGTTLRSNETLQIELTSEKSGFYLAVVDLGTCITIHHVVVSYSVCPAESAELIHRPETVAPASNVSGQCVENSSTPGGENPVIKCTNEGEWEVVQGCLCIPGYEGVTTAANLTGCAGVSKLIKQRLLLL